MLYCKEFLYFLVLLLFISNKTYFGIASLAILIVYSQPLGSEFEHNFTYRSKMYTL